MQGLFHTWRSRLAGSSVGAGLLALSLAFTSPAFAIPSDGTYDASGGMTGFFTISGTQLTDYSLVVGGLWFFVDEAQTQQSYEPALDQTYIEQSSEILEISWGTNEARSISGLITSVTFQSVLRPSSVPEPSSALLAGLGLLLLLGYGWRQRRQAGLQVG